MLALIFDELGLKGNDLALEILQLGLDLSQFGLILLHACLQVIDVKRNIFSKFVNRLIDLSLPNRRLLFNKFLFKLIHLYLHLPLDFTDLKVYFDPHCSIKFDH